MFEVLLVDYVILLILGVVEVMLKYVKIYIVCFMEYYGVFIWGFDVWVVYMVMECFEYMVQIIYLFECCDGLWELFDDEIVKLVLM